MVEVEGKKYPQFNLGRCIFCYACADNCRRNAIKSSANFELATTDKYSLIMTTQPNLWRVMPISPSSSAKMFTILKHWGQLLPTNEKVLYKMSFVGRRRR
jgi:formate hydrogenlyase subunit 6/NADH:ubiquinone oxidoreductase subunit I